MNEQQESQRCQTLELPTQANRSPLAEVMNQTAIRTGQASYPYTLIGRISALDPDGHPVVSFSIENRQYTTKAETTVETGREQIGQKCLIVFNRGNIAEPVVTGLVRQPTPLDEARPKVIHSETSIILKCGAARIELTEAGAINIQGMQINSQAYGPHRIKGGSVKVN